MGAAAPLQSLQRDLQEIYALQVPHDVDDFLCTDRELARYLGGGSALRPSRENLFVREDGEELNLSLYLDPDVVASLAGPGPDWSNATLGDYCLALEGVSHFVYVVWYASHARAVTLLEMELQAEIDKYVVLRGVLAGAAGGCAEAALERLFSGVDFHADLDAGARDRYREANHYAERYCRALERRFIRGGSRSGLLQELRSFYRRSRNGKLEHIRQLNVV